MPTAPVLDSTMFYRHAGKGGVPFVFLHGNPTSSHLWRHVLPRIRARARCLAPDLIGMGESGKPAIAYRFADHARYLDAWFDALEIDDVVLVGHDWGGALAFDWAARHPGRVRGIAFMETIVRPMSWDDFPLMARPLFRSFRRPDVGEALVIDENIFIEMNLPMTITSGIRVDDMNTYRAPSQP
jgi:haloalkane dehalogenase